MRMEFRFSVAKGQFTDEGNNDKQVCILYDILRLFPCGLSLLLRKSASKLKLWILLHTVML